MKFQVSDKLDGYRLHDEYSPLLIPQTIYHIISRLLINLLDVCRFIILISFMVVFDLYNLASHVIIRDNQCHNFLIKEIYGLFGKYIVSYPEVS